MAVFSTSPADSGSERHNSQSPSVVRRLSVWFYAFLLLILFVLPAFELVKRASEGELAISHADGKIFVSDFVRFYVAGKLAVSPDRFRCYDLAVQERLFRQLIGQDAGVSASMFHVQMVPMLFLIMAPLAYLSLNTAHAFFLIFSLALAIAGGFFLYKKSVQFNRNSPWLWLLWSLAPFSSFQALLTGQSSFFELGLFQFYLWSWLAKREIISGACLALSAIKPHYAVFMLLPAIVGKRWLTLLSLAVCEAALVIATSCFIGFDNIISYPRTVLGMDAGMNVNAAGMPCLRGVLSNLIADQHTVLEICLAGLVMALVVLWFLWRRALKSNGENQLRLMIISILIALAFSPHSHLYDYVLFVPSAIFIASWNILDLLEIRSVPVLVWSLILFFYPFLSWFLILCPGVERVHPMIFCVTLLLLIGCALPQFLQRASEHDQS